MKNTTKQLSKKKKIIFGIIGIVAILGAWWAYNAFGPKPLGDKLEYIGKIDYGCIIFCDVGPGSVYYYATDMSVGEVEKYFKRANIESPAMQRLEYIDITLQNQRTAKPIYLSYYESREGVHASDLKKSNKKHILEINSENYSLAKDSL
jgi:hypothetical protein